MSSSYNFNFKLTDRVWRDINKQFDLEAMNNGDDYRIILCSSMPSDFTTLRNNDGTLNTSASGYDEIQPVEDITFNLQCSFTDGGFVVTLDENEEEILIEIDDDDTYLVGMLLVKDSNDYILAYARTGQSIPVKDMVKIPFNSQIMGVGNCNS